MVTRMVIPLALHLDTAKESHSEEMKVSLKGYMMATVVERNLAVQWGQCLEHHLDIHLGLMWAFDLGSRKADE